MHIYTNHLGIWIGRLVDIDGVKVSDTKVLPVEGLGEVIDVVDEEASVIDGHCVPDVEVTGREVRLDLLVTQLHDDMGEGGRDMVAVLWHLAGEDTCVTTVSMVMGVQTYHSLIVCIY